jgi:hypothetical protein
VRNRNDALDLLEDWKAAELVMASDGNSREYLMSFQRFGQTLRRDQKEEILGDPDG